MKEPNHCFASIEEVNPAHLYLSIIEDEKRITIFRHFKENATFFVQFPELRAYINEAGFDLLQRKTTLHLAQQYLIAVLSKVDFPKSRLGLVAATCLLLASKYDELDNNVPLFEDVLSTLQDSQHLR